MSIDQFSTLLEGVHIVNQHTEARQCARVLCRWLADSMNASVVKIQFTDENHVDRWEERVGRIVSGATAGPWFRPFPDGGSTWLFDGGKTMAEHFAPILDIVAQLWLAKRRKIIVGRSGFLMPGEDCHPDPAWVAVSTHSRIIHSRLPQLSQSRNPLLLVGETGSGKRYLARLIHQNGPEPSAPFAGPDKDENRGTLFISDWRRSPLGEVGPTTRETRRIIVAVTPGKDINDLQLAWMAWTEGKGVVMKVPALRHRIEDLPLLAGHFLTTSSATLSRKAPELSPSALEAIRCYGWPGNARELKETMFRSLELMTEGVHRLGLGDLPPAVRGVVNRPSEPSFPERFAALECEALKTELLRQRGNMARTAQGLGLTPRQVSWRLKKYGIDPWEFKPSHARTAD